MTTTLKNDPATFKGWQVVDWQDLIPLPGSFVTPGGYRDISTGAYGTVSALNGAHAEYLGLKKCVAASGEEWGCCCRCGAHIRYAVVFEGPDRKIHMAGEDCAQFISSGLDLKQYAEKRLTKDIAKRETKRGTRYILNFETPQWFWSVPKDSRPKFISLSKFKPTGSSYDKWYVTVWGESHEETIVNYLQFLDLKQTAIQLATK